MQSPAGLKVTAVRGILFSMKKLIIARKISRLLFMVLFIYALLPSSCLLVKDTVPKDMFLKIDPLTQIFGSISSRVLFPGIVFAILMLALTLIFGRFFCGWVCPLGTVIDVFGDSRKKWMRVSSGTNKILYSVKYYILGIIALASIFGIRAAWTLDPMFIMLSLIVFGTVPLMAFACCSAFITKRFWCRAICPLGAIYAIAARFSLLRRYVIECDGCSRCKADCRMQAIKDDMDYVKSECILCMDCVYECSAGKTRFSWLSRAKRSQA